MALPAAAERGFPGTAARVIPPRPERLAGVRAAACPGSRTQEERRPPVLDAVWEDPQEVYDEQQGQLLAWDF